MTVEIPICENHAGSPLAIMKVSISDYCPKCGKKRGIDTIHKVRSYDGSLWLMCDGWTNPCGHIDYYEEVRKEVLQQNKERKNENTKTN